MEYFLGMPDDCLVYRTIILKETLRIFEVESCVNQIMNR